MSEDDAMTQEQLSIFDLREARDDGIRRAADHADAVIPQWSERAFAMLLLFLKANRRPFITPEVREWSTENGLPEPPTAYAWGAVLVRARKSGLIIKAGATTYGNKTMHLQTVNRWVPL